MRRVDLLPTAQRRERELLLDLFTGADTRAKFGEDVDAAGFFSVIPEPLYPLAFATLRPRAEALAAPEWLLTRLAVHYRGSMMLTLKRRALLRSTMEILDRAAIPHLVLKGPLLAWTLYADPATRTMSDLDFLVHADDLPSAIAALNNAGYRTPARLYGIEIPPGDGPALEAPDNAEALVELHSILDSTAEKTEATDGVWSRTRRVNLGEDLEITTLGEADFLAHVALHASKHHRFEGCLRATFDLALLLHAYAEQLNWDALVVEWQRHRTYRWMKLTIVLTHALFNAPLPAPLDDYRDIEDAIALAAAQLWSRAADRFPGLITVAIAGHMPAPIHARLPSNRISMPSGLFGIGARFRRIFYRIGRLTGAFRKGALRPGNIARELELFKKRDRLVSLMND